MVRLRHLLMAGLFLLPVAGVPARAVQLSPCQGNFEAVRGPGYSYALDPAGDAVPEPFAAEMKFAARAIYDHWHSLLAAEPPFVVDINLRFLADPGAFRALQAELAPDLPDVTGFYAWEGNLAAVLYDGSDAVESRRRALHELSHALTASQAGAAPHWLAEGLAEMHEMIRVDEGGWLVVANDRHLRHLDAGALPGLRAFFREPASAWYRDDSQGLYAIAWSLVYFLMGSAEGRGALGYTLQQAGTHSCQAYSAAAFLARAWPGGLADLERRWREWLAEGDFQPLPLH